MACRNDADCVDGGTCEAGVCIRTTLIDVLTADGRFGTLLAAVDAANLTEALRGQNQLTLFAPTDAAFQILEDAEPGSIQAILDDPETLLNILLYHLVAGRQLSGGVAAAESYLTLEGREITVSVNGNEVRINGIPLVQVDIEASNGVAHALGGVLRPPEPVAPGDRNLIEALRAQGNFETLLSAFDAVGFTETLADADEGPFTILAPTDAAFQMLEEANPGTLDALLADPDTLAPILLHHIFGGSVRSAAILVSETLITARPAVIDVEVGRDGAVTLGGARVAAFDIPATNGVIHAVSSVIAFPPDSPVGTCAIPAEIEGYGAWFGDTNNSFATQVGTCGEEAEAKEQVFAWRAAVDGRVCISTRGSRYDTVLHVRTDMCSARRFEIDCNDDVARNVLWSRLELEAMAGQVYFVMVDGFREVAGRYLLRINQGPCE